MFVPSAASLMHYQRNTEGGTHLKLISCVFNFDTANVDLLFDDGSSLVELDWLIYNEPLSYAQMLLDGSMETYLANVAK